MVDGEVLELAQQVEELAAWQHMYLLQHIYALQHMHVAAYTRVAQQVETLAAWQRNATQGERVRLV